MNHAQQRALDSDIPAARAHLETLVSPNPAPQSLHPKPHTLNPTPQTLHSKPFTSNPTCQTLIPNPSPQTLHTQPFTQNPSLQNLHPRHYTLNPTFSTPNPKPSTPNSAPKTSQLRLNPRPTLTLPTRSKPSTLCTPQILHPAHCTPETKSTHARTLKPEALHGERWATSRSQPQDPCLMT